MKQQKQQVCLQNVGSTAKKHINQNNKQQQQKQCNQESYSTITSKNFKMNNQDENEKENFYPQRNEGNKQAHYQGQKSKKPLTIEVEMNSKQRSYSALPALKRWSPPERINNNKFPYQLINEQQITNRMREEEKQNELYFAYFIINKNMDSFNPIIAPFTQENINSCYLKMNYLLKLNKTNM